MSLGVERAGFDIALAVDYDGHHVATHERNFPYGKSVCGSVADLDGSSLKKLADVKGEIDLVFGGPPCQGFSNMGLRDTHDPRNSLVFHFARIVNQIQPKAFIMENVTGLNMGDTASIFSAFLEEIQVSFNVTQPVRVLNAVDFGVPQARKRLFVIGIRKDVGKAAVYPDVSSTTPSVMEAIEDLPLVDGDARLLKEDICPFKVEPTAENYYAKRARGLSRYPQDYSRKRTWKKEQVSGCQRTRHALSSVELYQATEPGSVVPGHKLPRLDPDGVCPTLRAGATSERGSHTAPRPIHPVFPRVITAREAARLHGYPDWFSFYPSKIHACRQIGNSVCPPVAHAVALRVMEAIGVDPKSLPRDRVKLSDCFNLPEDRPLQHSRIPVKEEYPKVINHLWENAWDEEKQRLRNAEFGPTQIQRAIDETGALLPRVRAARFLYEAGQQRAIKDILALPLSHGFSIAILDREVGAGRFQPADAPASFGRPGAIVIKSSDLLSARPIKGKLTDFSSSTDIADFIEKKEVLDAISNGTWNSFKISRDMLGDPFLPLKAYGEYKAGKEFAFLILAFETGNLPYKRVVAALDKYEEQAALVILKLTRQHYAAVVLRLDSTREAISEKSRLILNLVPVP